MATVNDSPSETIETALENLRREWRSGCRATNSFRLANGLVHRLRPKAASEQAVAALDDLHRRMASYDRLPQDQRQDALVEIANALNAARPLLVAREPEVPFGKLPGAIAPGRASRATPRQPAATVPVHSLELFDPVTKLPRVGPAVAKKLANLNVATVGDMLDLAPRRHIDYSRTEPIGSALGFAHGREVTIHGEVIDIREVRGPGPPRVVVRISDGTGSMRVTWFNQYLAKQLALGDEIAISGAVDASYGAPSFTSPEWEKLAGGDSRTLSTGRLTPVYPLTQGMAQKTIRALTRAALDATEKTIAEFLPEGVRQTAGELQLPGLRAAYQQIHYPDSHSALEGAQRRLAFDDLFLLQLGLVRRKRERRAFGGVPLRIDDARLNHFRDSLPFQLTTGQERALAEIRDDLGQARPMARLLQGDVGSGKTVIAAAAALIARASAYQAAVMAPTEILAEQHFHNLRGLYAGVAADHQPRLAFLTGSTRIKDRREVLAAAASGEIDILVGTHALIQESVTFARLGLAIVDEQHRFGVRQRANLPDKATGMQPHLLSMTATPIPRTLNMVLNGDIDVSVIAELPPGRMPIETRRYLGAERSHAYELVRDQVELGHQVFIICPLVEASEVSEAKAAVAEAQRLQQDVFPELRVATLHGRMPGREKDRVMTAFRDREFDLLVATSVIEVGIDVPNATVMLVEGADRFGLAQLHQFRGRVGRGAARSFCLLLAEETTPDGEERLRMMVESDDGFALAEKDLQLRGPGDFIGTRQSGLPEMSWLDGAFDTRLLDRARTAAERILDIDPELDAPEHAALSHRLKWFWERASPDVPL
ncbi:MAG: ATP-dependent DNA helicase RecG [Chloroflexota bacterium]|nr:ATP-dependent DNA helicase RecG [Chloroflexota bacterium]